VGAHWRERADQPSQQIVPSKKLRDIEARSDAAEKDRFAEEAPKLRRVEAYRLSRTS
jgi:hypothetical protein